MGRQSRWCYFEGAAASLWNFSGGNLISLVVVPESTRVIIEVPPEFVNKRLRMDIHEEEVENAAEYALPKPDPGKLAEVEAFYATMRKVPGDVRFVRI